jgi:hypothetical protein
MNGSSPTSVSPASVSPSAGPFPQRRVLLALALIFGASAGYKLISLAAAAPLGQAPTALRWGGSRLTPQSSAAARSGRDLSHGTIRQFRLEASGSLPPLTLTLMPVRSRDDNQLEVSRFGAIAPRLALQLFYFVDQPHAGGADELAIGYGPGDDPKRLTRLQTCITPRGFAAAKSYTLGQVANTADQPGVTSPLQRRLLRASGLLPARHECLAVQLATGPAGASERQLREAWSALRPQLVGWER